MPSTVVLDVAVVGAGIAGLAAAIAIRRAGHNVTVYERSTFKNEVGAAINMPPHALRILRTWGIAGPNPTAATPYSDAASGTKLFGSRRVSAESAEALSESLFDGDEGRYGACFVSYHRADLHAALRKLAENAGAKIVLGKTVVDLDCDAAELRIANSPGQADGYETIKKDLIILADGVNTTFINKIAGQAVPLRDTGRSAYRTLVPMPNIFADAEAKALFENGGEHGLTGTLDPNTGVFVIAYPCRDGKVMNLAVFHKVKPEEADKRDWNSPATIAEAVDAMRGFHPAWHALVRAAEFMNVYVVSHRDPLPRYLRGRVLMMGDAAHAMLPTLAGGGATSLEDAAALEILLAGVRRGDEKADSDDGDHNALTNRLRLWEALRLPRDATMQVLSKSMLAPRPAEQFAAELRDFYIAPLPKAVLAGWILPTREFVCRYDAFAEAAKALQWAEEAGFPEEMMLRMQREGVVQHFAI